MDDLGALRELGDAHIVERLAGEVAQRAQGGHLERGARRQPHAHRHVGVDADVDGRHVDADRACLDEAAVHVGGEVLGRRLLEREALGAAELHRLERVHAVVAAAHRHARALRDRDGQHEPVVVVGVLAQQVHPPGRFCDDVEAGHATLTSTC